MKPKKNLVYCYGCQRSKMLFESQSKADNFIKYNSEDMLEETGKAPVRSYFCEMCGGYHVTSNPSREIGEKLNGKDKRILNRIDSFKKEADAFNIFRQNMTQRIDKAINLMEVGNFDEIKKLYVDFQLDMPRLKKLPLKIRSKYMLLYQEVEVLHTFSMESSMLEGISEKELNRHFVFDKPTKVQRSVAKLAKGLWLLTHVQRNVEDVKDLLRQGRLEECRTNIELLKKCVRKYKSFVGRRVISSCDIKIDQVERILLILEKEEKKSSSLEESAVTNNYDSFIMTNNMYKSAILSIIEKIEQIEKAYYEGDIDNCESLIEIADYLLNDINIKDSNTELLNQQLSIWKSRINNK